MHQRKAIMCFLHGYLICLGYLYILIKLPNGFFPQDNEKRFCDLLKRRYNFAALKTSLRNEFCLTDIKSVFCFVILHQVIMIVL